MNARTFICAALAALALPAFAQTTGTEWNAYNIPPIIDFFGSPEIFSTALGQAVHFNGSTDGAFVDAVPVKGMEEFTLEVIFRQDADAAFEQRFLHIGTTGPRILFETRVNPDGTWYFDTHVNLGSKEQSATLIAPKLTHPAGKWYNLTLVASKDGLVNYVNGVEQCRSSLPYRPVINEGFTSVGVRQNKVCWFKGDIFMIRVTPKALTPDKFSKDYIKLNGR